MLTALWALPALGGVLCLFTKGETSKRFATTVAAAMLGYTVWLSCVPYAPEAGVWGLVESGPAWIFGIRYQLALDGLALSLVWLTAFLTVVSFAASWRGAESGGFSAGFWSSFLFLEAALMGVFLSRDLFVFYVFWEATLIPMFFIIGLWGSEGRRHAAMKFFLFTFFGSLFMLVGLLALVTHYHAVSGVWTWDMGELAGANPTGLAGLLMFVSLIIGFGVKIPLFPMHTWLPDAHTEAPAAGSIMLAGVMLKMGVYGFIRVLLPVFPRLSWDLLPWLGGLACVNILYGSLCAMQQRDLKRLIAYSSVAHLGFCVLGVLSWTPEGVAGGSLQMLNHGITTGALFMMIGFLYERTHRRGLSDFGDLVTRAPWMTFFFGWAVMASIGLPGLNGFVGEFMCLAGMARALPLMAMVAAIGIVLSAAYCLPAYQTVFWGASTAGSVSSKVLDLDLREKVLVWLLCGIMLYIGLCPTPLLDALAPSVASLVADGFMP
ncbi:MAG: NADH-quinone oxidoreductase subunit M [Elusimicrobia bacterium]|nr:NADH-quinone oxidoreductase subunit M [Elusimicrobiota bacterium]